MKMLSVYSLGSRQRGVSLIEILISLVIGLVVVGAVLVSFVGSGQSGRYQTAYSQMNEDAQIALTLLSRDIQLAGYAQPTAVNASSTFVMTFSDRPVTGCDTGFAGSPAVSSSVNCNATGTFPAFEVGYEADLTNTVPTGGAPTDCLGAALTQVAGTPTYYIARNRYYLANTAVSGRPELHCASYKSIGGQPLIENVDAMKVWYGMANNATSRQIVRYVTASGVTAANDWNNVVSVRVCLLMRSSETVVTADEPVSYLDCDSASHTVADRYLRRAYFTTSTIRSKMSF